MVVTIGVKSSLGKCLKVIMAQRVRQMEKRGSFFDSRINKTKFKVQGALEKINVEQVLDVLKVGNS